MIDTVSITDFTIGCQADVVLPLEREAIPRHPGRIDLRRSSDLEARLAIDTCREYDARRYTSISPCSRDLPLVLRFSKRISAAAGEPHFTEKVLVAVPIEDELRRVSLLPGLRRMTEEIDSMCRAANLEHGVGSVDPAE